ncbi:glycosyltransferase, partial [Candidatus Woesearchaeota archaeon]|nr:glycosyltransferase [Candidatus Woesearchaeota archaeon]
MKIFFASQSFYPNIGGVSTYLLNLAKGLMQRGNDVIEVHLRPPNESSEDVVKGIKVFRIPKEPLKNELLKGYSNFKERIYKECHGEGEFFKKEPLITYGYDEYHQINLSLGKQIEELLEKNPAEIVHIHDFQLLLIYRNTPRGIPVILTWHIPFIDT